MDAAAWYRLSMLRRAFTRSFFFFGKSVEEVLLLLWTFCAGDVRRDLHFGGLLRLLGPGKFGWIVFLDVCHRAA